VQNPTVNTMKELTDSEMKKCSEELAKRLVVIEDEVLAFLLAQYIISKNGRHWKAVLSEIIELNKTTIKGN